MIAINFSVIRTVLLMCSITLLQGCIERPEPFEQAQSITEDTAINTTPETAVSPPSARLPDNIRPIRYKLQLTIDPGKEHFSGVVDIHAELSEPLPFFWMHGNNLEISQATATLDNGDIIELSWEQVLSTGTVKVSATRPLSGPEIKLHFEYSAPFNTSLEGLYKLNSGGENYAFTQFEASSARLAFPSFDEPAFKVPFDIRLTVPSAHSAITNTPQLSEFNNPDGTKTITFARTRPLPSYLVAFAVGPFDIVQWQAIPENNLRKIPIPLRGITTKGKGEQIKYALQNTAAIVEQMENYFDTPYPYAKLDIIAVPDFSAGAMENAGAITYREQLILLDEKASINQQRSFFITHAHELAHHWFGNLVTPIWWDDIWLNESFATWNAYITLDHLFPQEHYRDALLNSSTRVMTSDSLASARQIREPIERHEDIGSAFNSITYQKGGGVLLMFEAFLGRNHFRDGIRHYMKTFAFGNTSAYDFITAIAEANPHVDSEVLKTAFDSYIEQPGLPIVQNTLRCKDEGVFLELAQERYLPAGSEGSSEQQWTIPVCLSTFKNTERNQHCFLFKGGSDTFPLASESCPDAILPNTGGNGYYRWSLPASQWQALLANIGQLENSEQISLAGSLSAAFNKGTLSLKDYLLAVEPLTRATSWRVAMAPRSDLFKIRDHLLHGDERRAFKARLRQWYQPALTRLDTPAQTLSPSQHQFRTLLLSTLALGAGDESIHQQLATKGATLTGFGSDRQLNLKAVDADQHLIVLLAGVESHGSDFIELLWEHFLASDNALLREYLLTAMAWTTDPELAATIRERILSPELRDNEIFHIFSSQMAHEETRNHMFDWTADHFEAVLARIDNWRKGQLPVQFENFCSEEDARQVEALFRPVIDTLESGPRYLANTLESIRLCAAFVELHRPREVH